MRGDYQRAVKASNSNEACGNEISPLIHDIQAFGWKITLDIRETNKVARILAKLACSNLIDENIWMEDFPDNVESYVLAEKTL